MAFNFGSLLGGGLSGAASGFAMGGPVGAGIGGLLGGFGSLFGGGGTPSYEPTELQENLLDYALGQTKANEKTRRRISRKGEMLLRSSGPGAAEAFLEGYLDKYSNPTFIEEQLARSYETDPDYTSPSYRAMADELFRDQGIRYRPGQYGSFMESAKARGIRSPQAFADMIKQRMIAQGKIATPQQELFAAMFGGMNRNEKGKILDLYPKLNMRPELFNAGSKTTNTISVS